MNKYVKKGLCLVLATGLIASSFAGCAKINYVTDGAIQAIHEIKDGSWQETDDASGDAAASDADAPVIDALTPGTYGGVDFQSIEDVANYYVEAYNYSKTLMAEYKDSEGNTQTWYKLLGQEKLSVENIIIDGSSNAMINNLVPSIVDGIYHPGLNGLVPSTNRDPKLDTDEWDGNGESLQTSRLVADDLVAANVADNGDGTITIQLQPKAVNMSMPGKDAQGHVFQSLGAIDSTVDSIEQLTWSQGTTADNCKVNYAGGVATVTIDTATKEIVKADYVMKALVSVTHANILVIKDKSASLDVTMEWSYPASADYLMESKQCSLIG
ncbi:MAG: hypothetical protein PUE08_01870 [Eubacteriales bacterium]|nr:hypothetical protein [Eubacteriales bacterium]